MPTQPEHTVPEEFAGNEWLVEELFEKYEQDRNSVDETWWPLFDQWAGTTGSAPSSQQAPAPAAASAPAKEDPAKASVPSTPKTPVPEADPKSAPQAAPKASNPSATKPATPKEEPVSDAPQEDQIVTLRGPAKAVAANMDESLSVPTATTVRAIPAKLLIDNRTEINSYLARTRGGKVSFTHIIGYAIIRALAAFPSMNVSYGEDAKGKPAAIQHAHVNFGLAIDLPRPDGSRNLVVPNIKGAEKLSFSEFWEAYNDIVKRGREGKLGVEDFAGTTVSLTNPGGIGTVHSVPRLSKGQAAIIGAGALDYPAEYRGTSEKVIARNGVSKILTLTSTYDHRVIQGAGSGEFLKIVEHYLLGGDGFYDQIFEDLRIPFEPVRWARDNQVNPEAEISKVARIQQLIHAFRVRGHLIAQTNPIGYQMLSHPDLRLENYGLTLWDLDRYWPTGGFGEKESLPLRTILELLREAYTRTLGVEYMHIENPEERQWF
ncbi:MAG TPA: 2-oxo acid dehydrogenase subunit E2, partial [Candidatus Rothia avistercoris]|nr:2-oxo acid dehydrogenase subunit E2 [Candidatus Rothia avistercoris]